MAKIAQPSLFDWSQIEASSDLDRLSLVLSALPDEKIMQALEHRRNRGRNDYPVRPTWNAIIAGIVFNHPTMALLRRELLRNAELRQLCGFDLFLGDKAVPSARAFSSFITSVIDQDPLVEEMFHTLVERLKAELPELGQKLAVDSKAIPSFGNPVTDEEKKNKRDGRRDNDADWGKKSYSGQRKDGTAWSKVKSWFGYKLHLMIDSEYELPLAYDISPASHSDMNNLLPLVDDLQVHHPSIADDAEELSADRGYDSAENKKKLYDEHKISPIIDNRVLWQGDDKNGRPVDPNRADVFLFNEQGRVFCQCPSERVGEDKQRDLVFVGFEKDRNTLKFRCPAAYYGLDCPGRAACEANANVKGDFGRVLRLSLDKDRRILTPSFINSLKWKTSYNRRSAVERVNSRVDLLLGFERHTIRGKNKLKMRMGLSLAVMLAMALGRIQAGQRDKMRSMTLPVVRAA